MAQKRLVRSVAVVMSAVFVMSAFVIVLSPPVSAAEWLQTTDADFNNNNGMNGVEIIGTGAAAYVQLIKDQYNWFNKNPGPGPSARQGASMVYDAFNGRVFLFGGYDVGGNAKNDTWSYTFSTNTWNNIELAAPPRARYYAGMAYDTANNIVVLYGGVDATGTGLTDTWEYDVTTSVWTNTTLPVKPQRLYSSPMTYDSTVGRIIMASQGLTGWETWDYDVTTNIWTLRMGATTWPQQRSGHSLVYYPDIQRTVLYGGSWMLTTWSETWEYNYGADNWVNHTGNTGGQDPGQKSGYTFVYRPDKGDILLWGGTDYTTQTWNYIESGGRFWSVVPAGGNPTARSDHVMAYDFVENVAVVFGGKTSTGTRLGDTWAFEPGFRSSGSIRSQVFDSVYGNTVWQWIAFNQTTIPPGGTLRFHVAASNNSDPAVLAGLLGGPDGTVSTYYTSSGQAIWSGTMNKRYFMWAAYLLCAGCSDSPRVEDVTITYFAPPIPPYVVSRGPETAGMPIYNPPIDTPIWINFSEPMDTTQVTVTITGVTLTPNWDPTDTQLTLTHAVNFQFCTAYTPTITQAVDKTGQSMTGLPYSWLFVTICPEPEIKHTYPQHNSVDIDTTFPIYVNFSKPMNESSIVVTFNPPLSGLTPIWSNNSSDLRVDHATPMTEGTWYDVTVAGKDKWNKSLIPGPVPNPWQFRTRYGAPIVVSTDPTDGEIEVPLTKSVIITFSQEMNTGSVMYTFTPTITVSPSWNSPSNDVLTLVPSTNYQACTKYTVNVTGQDIGGRQLFGGYYEWWFFTTCGGSPFVLVTTPQDGEIDVALDQPVIISFSESMNPATVTYTVEPAWVYIPTWVGMNMVLNLDHGDNFTACTKYYINITGGRDLNENKPLVPGPVPDHFSFSTSCINPFVVTIDPPHGSIGVANDTNIVVTFSKTINTTTFDYRLSNITLIESWNPTNTVFTLSHGPLFEECKLYILQIMVAEDLTGNPLIGQNEFNFTTSCGNPVILLTDPADQEVDVALDKVIMILFNKPIDPSTYAWTITPFVNLNPIWNAPDYTIVNMTHTTDFAQGTTYTVRVTSACDFFGNCLGVSPVPNPWIFTTISTALPQITSTDPSNGDTNVPLTKSIVVQFSVPMDTAQTSATLSPPDVTLVPNWNSPTDTILTLTHSAPFLAGRMYTVSVTGRDKMGNNLVSGPVPNPWSFTTTFLPGAPGGLEVHRVGADIQLTWRPASDAVGYNVYESTDRFRPWPWPVLANVTTTTHTHSGANSDGLTHFYIVRGYNIMYLEGPNSTMGAKMSRTFTVTAGGSHAEWFSLPYNTIYSRASDIANELTDTNINIVAKWNPNAQKSILYYYLRGKWRGQDYTISPGDGLWLGVVNTFTWSVNGTDSAAFPLTFSFTPSAKSHYYWISLPYTNSYQYASDISTELTSAKIGEIGRYDPTTGGIQRWYHDGVSWVGDNFAIMAGDGIYLVVKATFTWTPLLITPEVP